MPRSNTIGSSLWGFEFYQFNTYQFQAMGNGHDWDYDGGDDFDLWSFMRQENQAFGHAVYESFTPLPPQIIISYPFTGTQVPDGTVLCVQASASAGRVTRVVVDVDGSPYKTLTSWPYLTTITNRPARTR